MRLYDELAKLGQQVKSQLPQMKNHESATVHVSVLPFIRALGYNTQDLSEVYPEYSILNMDAVDYAVLRDSEPIMFLEAKKAGENLGAKHWKQLFEYFNADKARIGILTNGIKYQFYSDFDQKNLMDKAPFLTLDVLKLDKAVVEAIAGFTKANYDPEKSLRKLKIRNLIEQELREPSDDFVRHFAKQVHDGALWKEVIEEYRQIVLGCLLDLTNDDVAPPPEEKDNEPDPIRILPKPQTWLDGSAEIPVVATWKDHDFDAILRLRGKIANVGKIVLWDGEWLNPLIAGEAARKTVEPDTKGYVNGMTFWQFRDPLDDKLRPIIDLCHGWHNDWELILRVLRNATR